MRLTSTIATAPLRISNTTGGQSFLGHRGGAIGAGSPVGEQILDSANRGTQLAIIGAGAAGLAAGYEMMKLGLQPVFFEMQSDPGHQDYVRPLGRGFSWDFTSSGNPTDGGGFTSWFPQVVQGPGPTPDNQPRFPLGRQIADFGAMRYPATHIALHTYVDDMFVVSGDYYYGVNRHRKLHHFRHRKVSHPRPGLWRRFRGGFALAAPAVPLLAHGFRDWLRWLSSVVDAGGTAPAVTPQTSLAGVGGGTPPMPDEEEPPACGRNRPDRRFSLSR